MPHTAAARRVVALALARGAVARAYQTDLTPDDERRLADLLGQLVRQGVVACFSLAPPAPTASLQAVLDDLRPHVGAEALEATLAAGPPPPEPPPAYLLSVWPFEAVAGGGLKTAGQFLGLDLAVTARPSPDPEAGFRLPGVDGGLGLYATPLF